MNKIHPKIQKYDRFDKVDIEFVMPHLMSSRQLAQETRREFKERVEIKGVPVGVSSLRLMTFAVHGTTCSCCGLKATHFAIERDMRDIGKPMADKPYHLNLYGIQDGFDILFTHDHTKARALGGVDNLSNTTTMCFFCNMNKSVGERKQCEAIKLKNAKDKVNSKLSIAEQQELNRQKNIKKKELKMLNRKPPSPQYLAIKAARLAEKATV